MLLSGKVQWVVLVARNPAVERTGGRAEKSFLPFTYALGFRAPPICSSGDQVKWLNAQHQGMATEQQAQQQTALRAATNMGAPEAAMAMVEAMVRPIHRAVAATAAAAGQPASAVRDRGGPVQVRPCHIRPLRWFRSPPSAKRLRPKRRQGRIFAIASFVTLGMIARTPLGNYTISLRQRESGCGLAKRIWALAFQ